MISKSMTAQDLVHIQTQLDCRLPQSYLHFMLANRPRLESMFNDREQIIEENLAARTQCWLGDPLDKFSFVFGRDAKGRLLLLDLDLPGGVVMQQNDESSDPIHRVRLLNLSFEQWIKSVEVNATDTQAADNIYPTAMKVRYPIFTIGLGLLIGIGLCTVGFQRFAAISRQFSTLPSGIPFFAAGLYVLLLTVMRSVMHPRPPAPRLRTPWIVLAFAVPACWCISLAVEHFAIPFPDYGTVSGFWDMKLEKRIEQDDQVFWTTSAALSSLFTVLALLIWIRPVTRRTQIQGHSTSPEMAKNMGG